MKILWLCNIPFSDVPGTSTGSWLQPLADKLSSTVLLGNISFGKTDQVVRSDFHNIQQWIVPSRRAGRYGQEASLKTCKEIINIIEAFKPDIVHIWGTENVWASIHRLGYIKPTVLLEIQGLLGPCSNFYLGGLTNIELVKSISLKEIILPWRNLLFKQFFIKKRGEEERLNLMSFEHISTQSNWVRNYIREVNPQATIYTSGIILRDEFYSAEPWFRKEFGSAPIIFSSFSGSIPYKGMHMLLRMIALLKKDYHNIKLKIAGEFLIGNRLFDGYGLYLQSMIKKLRIEDNVIILGCLNAKKIVEEIQSADVCVVPSFVETYCLAFAEDMIVGCPTVCAFSGAMPEFAIHGKEALFYNALDYRMGVACIREVLENPDLAESLSVLGRERRRIESNPGDIVKNQLSIYKKIKNDDV